jgi:hypothetical protein
MESKEISKKGYDVKYNDGIVFITYAEDVIVTLEMAKELVQKRKELSNYTLSPGLVDGRFVKEVTKDARDYFGSSEGEELVSAAALVVGSVFTKSIANFLINFSFKKVKVPVKMFNDMDEALVWLKNFV